ncbi:MAG: YitT family protein [Desulfobulbaceae bacterium]|nr:YitT family protein [Desulfobulbaceae bacterium]
MRHTVGINLQNIKFSVPWNLFLLTVGSVIFVVGINGIVIHHSFIPGGLFGLCLFIFDKTDLLSPGIWFLVLNLPLCILGWMFVSRRFVLYTIYSILVITLASELITIDFAIHEQIYAAVAAGFICGSGFGIILRSLGSAGGLDVIAIILNKYFNIGIGKTFLMFNLALFSLVISNYGADIVIASIILTFITSNSLDYFLSLFNQRKIVYVISDFSEEIAQTIMKEMKIGATFIKGRGAYSGRDKEILMAITNNIQLKRMEEKVFTIDSDALFIVENSYDVIGSTFKKRKIY